MLSRGGALSSGAVGLGGARLTHGRAAWGPPRGVGSLTGARAGAQERGALKSQAGALGAFPGALRCATRRRSLAVSCACVRGRVGTGRASGGAPSRQGRSLRENETKPSALVCHSAPPPPCSRGDRATRPLPSQYAGGEAQSAATACLCAFAGSGARYHGFAKLCNLCVRAAAPAARHLLREADGGGAPRLPQVAAAAAAAAAAVAQVRGGGGGSGAGEATGSSSSSSSGGSSRRSSADSDVLEVAAAARGALVGERGEGGVGGSAGSRAVRAGRCPGREVLCAVLGASVASELAAAGVVDQAEALRCVRLTVRRDATGRLAASLARQGLPAVRRALDAASEGGAHGDGGCGLEALRLAACAAVAAPAVRPLLAAALVPSAERLAATRLAQCLELRTSVGGSLYERPPLTPRSAGALAGELEVEYAELKSLCAVLAGKSTDLPSMTADEGAEAVLWRILEHADSGESVVDGDTVVLDATHSAGADVSSLERSHDGDRVRAASARIVKTRAAPTDSRTGRVAASVNTGAHSGHEVDALQGDAAFPETLHRSSASADSARAGNQQSRSFPVNGSTLRFADGDVLTAYTHTVDNARPGRAPRQFASTSVVRPRRLDYSASRAHDARVEDAHFAPGSAPGRPTHTTVSHYDGSVEARAPAHRRGTLWLSPKRARGDNRGLERGVATSPSGLRSHRLGGGAARAPQMHAPARAANFDVSRGRFDAQPIGYWSRDGGVNGDGGSWDKAVERANAMHNGRAEAGHTRAFVADPMPNSRWSHGHGSGGYVSMPNRSEEPPPSMAYAMQPGRKEAPPAHAFVGGAAARPISSTHNGGFGSDGVSAQQAGRGQAWERLANDSFHAHGPGAAYMMRFRRHEAQQARAHAQYEPPAEDWSGSDRGRQGYTTLHAQHAPYDERRDGVAFGGPQRAPAAEMLGPPLPERKPASVAHSVSSVLSRAEAALSRTGAQLSTLYGDSPRDVGAMDFDGELRRSMGWQQAFTTPGRLVGDLHEYSASPVGPVETDVNARAGSPRFPLRVDQGAGRPHLEASRAVSGPDRDGSQLLSPVDVSSLFLDEHAAVSPGRRGAAEVRADSATFGGAKGTLAGVEDAARSADTLHATGQVGTSPGFVAAAASGARAAEPTLDTPLLFSVDASTVSPLRNAFSSVGLADGTVGGAVGGSASTPQSPEAMRQTKALLSASALTPGGARDSALRALELSAREGFAGANAEQAATLQHVAMLLRDARAPLEAREGRADARVEKLEAARLQLVGSLLDSLETLVVGGQAPAGAGILTATSGTGGAVTATMASGAALSEGAAMAGATLAASSVLAVSAASESRISVGGMAAADGLVESHSVPTTQAGAPARTLDAALSALRATDAAGTTAVAAGAVAPTGLAQALKGSSVDTTSGPATGASVTLTNGAAGATARTFEQAVVELRAGAVGGSAAVHRGVAQKLKGAGAVSAATLFAAADADVPDALADSSMAVKAAGATLARAQAALLGSAQKAQQAMVASPAPSAGLDGSATAITAAGPSTQPALGTARALAFDSPQGSESTGARRGTTWLAPAAAPGGAVGASNSASIALDAIAANGGQLVRMQGMQLGKVMGEHTQHAHSAGSIIVSGSPEARERAQAKRVAAKLAMRERQLVASKQHAARQAAARERRAREGGENPRPAKGRTRGAAEAKSLRRLRASSAVARARARNGDSVGDMIASGSGAALVTVSGAAATISGSAAPSADNIISAAGGSGLIASGSSAATTTAAAGAPGIGPRAHSPHGLMQSEGVAGAAVATSATPPAGVGATATPLPNDPDLLQAMSTGTSGGGMREGGLVQAAAHATTSFARLADLSRGTQSSRARDRAVRSKETQADLPCSAPSPAKTPKRRLVTARSARSASPAARRPARARSADTAAAPRTSADAEEARLLAAEARLRASIAAEAHHRARRAGSLDGVVGPVGNTDDRADRLSARSAASRSAAVRPQRGRSQSHLAPSPRQRAATAPSPVAMGSEPPHWIGSARTPRSYHPSPNRIAMKAERGAVRAAARSTKHSPVHVIDVDAEMARFEAIFDVDAEPSGLDVLPVGFDDATRGLVARVEASTDREASAASPLPPQQRPRGGFPSLMMREEGSRGDDAATAISDNVRNGDFGDAPSDYGNLARGVPGAKGGPGGGAEGGPAMATISRDLTQLLGALDALNRLEDAAAGTDSAVELHTPERARRESGWWEAHDELEAHVKELKVRKSIHHCPIASNACILFLTLPASPFYLSSQAQNVRLEQSVRASARKSPASRRRRPACAD